MNFTKDINLVTVALCFLVLTGCHKDNDTTGSLHLNLPVYIGSNPVDSLNKFYADENGRPLALSMAQFYISDVSLKNASGTWYTIPNSYLLQRWNNKDFVLSNIPVGTYTDIRFNVGLDLKTDTSNPAYISSTGPDSALSLSISNEYSMYYGWQWQGYVFMYIEGSVDMSAAHDGSQLTSIVYLIGGNSGANLKTVTLPAQSFSIASNQSSPLTIICDYGRLLEGINMAATANTKSDTYNVNTATASLVADSIPTMFRYE